MIKIGADPELFLMKDGKPQNAYGIIPGTKQEPHAVKKGAIQVDGMALEFNIEPAISRQGFVNNINSVMCSLRDMVPKEYDIVISPSIRFEEDYMAAQPAQSLELGCDPDFNAYTLDENEAPNGDTTLRTGAGHIHIGWTEGEDPNDQKHMLECARLVKELDCTLGLFSTWYDRDTERKQLYGKAGAFRPKPYGVEYRVLSNFWLESNNMIGTVYDLIQFSIRSLQSSSPMQEKIFQDTRFTIPVQDVVNNNQRDWARAAVLEYNIPFGI